MPGREGRAPSARGASTASPERREAPGRHARRSYRAYRRRQAAELLDLVPSEAVRSLYARARSWAVERGQHDEKDPRATLLRFCEHLLPLPPFEVWHRHLLRSGTKSRAPSVRSGTVQDDPGVVEVDLRSFRSGDARWYATLSLFRGGRAWRGFITFHRGPDTSRLRTATIFREERRGEVRARFREFDEPALRAFLRSVRS